MFFLKQDFIIINNILNYVASIHINHWIEKEQVQELLKREEKTIASKKGEQ
jgi:hypothetical protein